MNNIKKRGRKKSTPEQREAYHKWHNQRLGIISLLKRNPYIEKKCCICGKQGKTLHNRNNPYYITFICDECKKDKNNLIIAEESRFDVRTKLDKKNLTIENFTDDEVIKIVKNYMNDTLSEGDYCNKAGISRYQLHQIMKRCQQLFPKQNIEQLVKSHSNKIQSEKLKRIAEMKKTM